MRRRALLLAAPLPVAIFAAYGLLRVFQVQPQLEGWMSELITSGFLLAGAAICYQTGVVLGLARGVRAYLPWLLAASLLLLLGVDETFMVHEALEKGAGVPEKLTLGFYFAIFVCVLWLLRAHVTRDALVLLGLFGLTYGAALVADTVFGEGKITLAGREIDYEQTLEALGALFLAGAFAVMATHASRSADANAETRGQ